jgi:ribosomal protein L22
MSAWDDMKVDELKDELEARGLPKSGTKAELVARLEEHEAAGGDETPAPTEAADAARDEGPAGGEATAEVHDVEEAEEEPEADEDAVEGPEADEEEALPARTRGSAETGAPRRKAPPRREEGAVVVAARAKYVRSAPRKARLVMNHIRGKEVEHAQAILRHAPRAVSADILKLLNSAVANAESAYELGPDELRVKRAFVDEGPTIKRFRPRALGRATRINKRTSHMTIELTTESDGR